MPLSRAVMAAVAIASLAQAFQPLGRSMVSRRWNAPSAPWRPIAVPPSSTSRLHAEQFMLGGLVEGQAMAVSTSQKGAEVTERSRVRSSSSSSTRSSSSALDSVLTQMARAGPSVLDRGAASTIASQAEAEQQVLAATKRWLDTVTSGKPTAPKDTAQLYARDGVLWGTVSEQLRVTGREIEDYFNYFARLPQLRVRAYKPFVRVYGDLAINDGYYTFAYQGQDGEFVEKRARFSFVFRRAGTGNWEIVDHHSSLVPTAPAALKPADTVVM